METSDKDAARVVTRALAASSYGEALDEALRGIAEAPADPRLHYLAALACARVGAVEESSARLDRAVEFCGDDPELGAEIAALRGRLAKERFVIERSREGMEARRHARDAADCYRESLRLRPSHYAAINAATMARLQGDEEACRALRAEALQLASGDGHWEWATRGEALLLGGDTEGARRAYSRAHALAGKSYGDVASMRRQLKLIASPEALAMLTVLRAPHVISFSGHMIDRPDRATPRFPPRAEDAVRERIAAAVERLSPAVAYGQAACGADILFLEALQERGDETQVVLPFARGDFIRESVEFAGGAWVGRFERVLERAQGVTYATEEPYLDDDVLFEHATNLIQGMALLRAEALEAEPVMLTVLAGPGGSRAVGGTAANVAAWRGRGGRIVNIALDGADDHAATAARSSSGRSLKSILFADITGFSRMPEQYSPRFAQAFLGAARGVLDALGLVPADANTRGDGLYMVFDTAPDAAEFALRLRDAVAAIPWTSMGMPAGTHVRIGLHTGPVFTTADPIMGKNTFNGSHVNRAARLEPIVRPGHIFVTQAFAATLALDGRARYRCEYIGVTPLAKDFGRAPLYRLRREDPCRSNPSTPT